MTGEIYPIDLIYDIFSINYLYFSYKIISRKKFIISPNRYLKFPRYTHYNNISFKTIQTNNFVGHYF